jgi:pre-rRNA-processing protein IPI1
MGSSAKRKKEKKKDFQKPKLRVGKAKPKAANFTDTSYKAKCTFHIPVLTCSEIVRMCILMCTLLICSTIAIVLSQQSLSLTAPTTSSQFNHHLSLLTSKSESQRRDSLAYLTSVLANPTPDTALPQPVSVVLSKLQPLILDGSPKVRDQLIKLFHVLPAADVASKAEGLLLHVRAGMLHLSQDVRRTSLEMLEWLVTVAGEAVVEAPGGWIKMVNTFLAVLGWEGLSAGANASAGGASIDGKGAKGHVKGSWSTSKTSVQQTPSGGNVKMLVRQLNALGTFLRAGLTESAASQQEGDQDGHSKWFPLWHTEYHMLPKRSNVYAHLNLFGRPRDEDTTMYEDVDDRRDVFRERFWGPISEGLKLVKREGGEIGRAAGQVQKLLADYLPEE